MNVELMLRQGLKYQQLNFRRMIRVKNEAKKRMTHDEDMTNSYYSQNQNMQPPATDLFEFAYAARSS